MASSPLPIICMLTMPLGPARPLEARAAFMPGSMRPGPIPWVIMGPPPPPRCPWGPQPCCMEPRMDPLLSMSAEEKIITFRDPDPEHRKGGGLCWSEEPLPVFSDLR